MLFSNNNHPANKNRINYTGLKTALKFPALDSSHSKTF